MSFYDPMTRANRGGGNVYGRCEADGCTRSWCAVRMVGRAKWPKHLCMAHWAEDYLIDHPEGIQEPSLAANQPHLPHTRSRGY